ncbi:MAG: DNA-formamidopyrimidine glycosylase family protein [Acidimicrobiales bacterium]
MPEIQAHAERMTAALSGATLTRFDLLNFAALKTFDPPADAAAGHPVERVDRRGKYLIIRFDGEFSHVVHLMQGGRLRPDPKPSAKPRGGMARWRFADGPDGDTAWLLTEAGSERKAGVWARRGDPLTQAPLNHLGPEADTLSRAELARRLGAGGSRRLHGWLRDQKNLAGVGRLLANEICYEAELSPFVTTAKLDDDDIDRLHAAIGAVIARATEHERTLDGIGSSADRPSKVHNRSGEPCPDCDDTIRTVTYRAYTVYYCPTRQTGGKLLADNTTSRFLK